jgi:intracellular multiplication protein IcmE
VEASNEADLERALQEGESTLPVPVETPSERLQLPQEEVAEEDPLHRWRKLQEERVVRDTREREEVEPVTVLNSEQQNEAMQRLVESMSRQMESVLSRRTEKKTFSYVSTISGDAFDGAGAGGAAGGAANGDDDLGEEIDEDDTGEMVIPAGEIEYAQLLIEANSDVPGPVMALLVSGPLKGSRVLGTFSVQNDKYLTVTFDSVIVDGESVDISAIALDPDTTLPGMATEVDNRYFQRVLLPAAAAFVEGFADALSESGSTTITIDTGGSASATETADKTDKQEVATGVEEAAEEVRDIIDDMADDIEVLVKIHAGTPMGILFTEPVVLDSSSGFDDEI